MQGGQHSSCAHVLVAALRQKTPCYFSNWWNPCFLVFLTRPPLTYDFGTEAHGSACNVQPYEQRHQQCASVAMELAGDPTNTAATAKPLSIIEHARHESPDTAARVSDQAHCLPNLITTTEASPAALEPSLQQEYDPKQPEVAQPDSSKEAVEQQSRISASPPAAACQAWIAAAKEGDTKEMHKLLQQHPGLLDYQAGGLRCSALHWTAGSTHSCRP